MCCQRRASMIRERNEAILQMCAILSKICSDGVMVSIGSWREAEIAFEHLGQVTLARKSAL